MVTHTALDRAFESSSLSCTTSKKERGELMAHENSLKNLMPIEEVNSRRTPEQHSADSRNAGIASGKARNLKSLLLKALEEGGYETMVDVAMKEIENGNARFWELVRDTVGEKPVDKQELDIREIPKINVVRKNG